MRFILEQRLQTVPFFSHSYTVEPLGILYDKVKSIAALHNNTTIGGYPVGVPTVLISSITTVLKCRSSWNGSSLWLCNFVASEPAGKGCSFLGKHSAAEEHFGTWQSATLAVIVQRRPTCSMRHWSDSTSWWDCASEAHCNFQTRIPITNFKYTRKVVKGCTAVAAGESPFWGF